MRAAGLSRSSPNGAVLPGLLRPQSGFPESPYLVGRYGEIKNAIDNLDDQETLFCRTLVLESGLLAIASPGLRCPSPHRRLGGRRALFASIRGTTALGVWADLKGSPQRRTLVACLLFDNALSSVLPTCHLTRLRMTWSGSLSANKPWNLTFCDKNSKTKREPVGVVRVVARFDGSIQSV